MKNKIKNFEKILKNIKIHIDRVKKLTNFELIEKTKAFKNEIKHNKKTLDEILPEAYAVVFEACKRVKKIDIFDIQIIGGIVLHQGNIAEMKTGEGKTLAAVFPAYLNALTGKGVHIVTVNDYLAQRDKKETEKIFNFLGMNVGVITEKSTIQERKMAYKCDITYGSNKEFGFDYLRDNLSQNRERIVQKGLEYAIIDESDSVLIDEALLPLIISNTKIKSDSYYYAMANQLVRRLNGITINNDKIKNKKYQKRLEMYDYVFDMNTYSVYLTEKGIKKAEEDYKIKNFYDVRNIKNIHYVYEALIAHNIMKKDIDYIVENGKVLVVDQNIGRVSKGKQFNNGLQQAIEAKEYLEITNEGEILAIITFQNYFKMYKKIAGMTGTIMSSYREIEDVYHLKCYEIPTNKPIKRKDKKTKVFLSSEERNEAVLEEVKNTYKKEQPILIGTSSIKTSQVLSKMLEKEKIPHELLNAKNPEREAEIIAKAGEVGKVTIATNMAGRGTDIKLQNEQVKELGGLKIIGVELNDSIRIDNQLRGRSGRQGDVGESQFFISIEQQSLKPFIKVSKHENNRALEKKCMKAQIEIENRNFTTRKSELKYDDILNLHRNIIYGQRNMILQESDLDNFSKEIIKKLLNIYKKREKKVIEKIEDNFGKDKIEEKAIKKYNENKKKFSGKFDVIRREIMIKAIDANWKEHINNMENLKLGIPLKIYKKRNPIYEYNIDSYKLFEELQNNIIEDIGMNLLFAH